ncbi:MAG: hypothetical protein C4527_01780 [Candidatus Omnitrophota bacterium]|jgi:hypothetical protein|nr:MAG: hypothetical protein C4527_01780 [Candidatus Omnitrophota bacterium]
MDLMKNGETNVTDSEKGTPQRELSSVTIREEYSFEEIQKMLGDIDGLLTEHQAANHGIDPENMVKTVRGGRVIWITKEEMNAILDKKRKFMKKKMVQRSVREDNSLSAEIIRRIELCKTLIDLIRKTAPEEMAGFIRHARDLDIVRNRSLSLSREIRLLESAIQRKKKEDPILSEMEKATTEMVSALGKNTLAEVDVHQSFRDRHMDEYLAKQKRIEPYIKKAKECRRAFLRTKQQIFQFEYDLLAHGRDVLAAHIEEIIYHDRKGDVSKPLVVAIEEIRALISSGLPFFQTLEGYSDEELEEQDELFEKVDREYLIPLFDQFVCFTELFERAWSRLVKGEVEELIVPDVETPEAPEKKTRHMVYPERLQHE